jgi:F0F1-type ATP synthase assembly protein I
MITLQDPEKRRRLYRLTADLLNVGLVFPAGIAVGYVLGYLLDRWWGSAPWMAVLLSIAGAGAGFVNLFRVVSRIDD